MKSVARALEILESVDSHSSFTVEVLVSGPRIKRKQPFRITGDDLYTLPSVQIEVPRLRSSFTTLLYGTEEVSNREVALRLARSLNRGDTITPQVLGGPRGFGDRRFISQVNIGFENVMVRPHGGVPSYVGAVAAFRAAKRLTDALEWLRGYGVTDEEVLSR